MFSIDSDPPLPLSPFQSILLLEKENSFYNFAEKSNNSSSLLSFPQHFNFPVEGYHLAEDQRNRYTLTELKYSPPNKNVKKNLKFNLILILLGKKRMKKKRLKKRSKQVITSP